MTPYSKAQQEYLQSEIFAAGPVRRIQLLYEGAIESVSKARMLLLARDIRGRTAQANKSILILTELLLALDHSAGNPLTKTLAELYDYSQRRLIEGNASQNEQPFAEVERLLKTLLEGWTGIPELETLIPRGSGQYKPADNGSGDSVSVGGLGSSLDQLG